MRARQRCDLHTVHEQAHGIRLRRVDSQRVGGDAVRVGLVHGGIVRPVDDLVHLGAGAMVQQNLAITANEEVHIRLIGRVELVALEEDSVRLGMHRVLRLPKGGRRGERSGYLGLVGPVYGRGTRGHMIAAAYRDELRVLDLLLGTIGAPHSSSGERATSDVLVRIVVHRALRRQRSRGNEQKRQSGNRATKHDAVLLKMVFGCKVSTGTDRSRRLSVELKLPTALDLASAVELKRTTDVTSTKSVGKTDRKS